MSTDLFGERPRRKARQMMHVIDAGDAHCGATHEDMAARFKCAKCGTETDWLPIRSITEGRRGIPCEQCNGGTDRPDSPP